MGHPRLVKAFEPLEEVHRDRPIRTIPVGSRQCGTVTPAAHGRPPKLVGRQPRDEIDRLEEAGKDRRPAVAAGVNDRSPLGFADRSELLLCQAADRVVGNEARPDEAHDVASEPSPCGGLASSPVIR